MMFKINWTERAAQDYADIKASAVAQAKAGKAAGKKKSSKSEGLLKQVAKTVQLLSTNPRHPGLQTHEYSSLQHPFDPQDRVFEAYAQNNTPGAYRVFWCYGPKKKQITIIAITPHP
jgi:hypothetical protein